MGNELKSMPALPPETGNSRCDSAQTCHSTPEAILSDAASEDNKYPPLAFHLR